MQPALEISQKPIFTGTGMMENNTFPCIFDNLPERTSIFG